MITYATDENFKELIAEGFSLVDFFGQHCVPCKALSVILEDLEEDMPFVNIIKVDTDKCPETAHEYKINGIPDLYFIKDGNTVFHSVGLISGESIRDKITEIIY